ncbi:hypothetical protein CK203_055701 [Vitis vinifera]|uniref:Retrotransposon gag domain-containing protein n=1 Tax=Vitis vinifera TaxID=29760 RepID=A0A438FV90_VITVI|nr:hypothetical protein CK203_055701 [Vitis vinifera]
MSLNIMEATPEDQHSHHGHQDNPNAFRSMRDRMHPPRMSAPSCIVPPTKQLVIKPHIVPLLPTFHGMESENPYSHIRNLKIYMEAINACPHHGFDTWLLVRYFYDGMSSSMKQLLETMCGGDFMSKNPEEAMDFLSYVAGVSRGWDEPNKGEVGKMKSQPNAFNAKAGILEELELKKIHEVQAIAETPVQVKPCPICQSYEHLVEECPTIPAAREMFGEQENVIGQFKPNNNASLTNLNIVQKKGRFPSQPHQNPKGIHEVETHEGESSQVRDVKALITLRSGKKVELPTPKPHVEKEEEEETEKSEEIKGKKKDINEGKKDHDSIVDANLEKVLIKEEMMKKHTPPPFPQDMCTIKRGLNVNKKAFLTEQVSAIIQCKPPLKYKDPGCPTISVNDWGKVVEKALLDLGAIDRSVKIPRGIIEDVLIQVDNFYSSR